jgi:hypothetical protein
MLKFTTLTGLSIPTCLPTTKQVLAAAAGVFTLGALTLFALISVVFFAIIILLSWMLNLALTFVHALGSHLFTIWTTGDDFTKALMVLIIGYIAFRLVLPHVRVLIRK